MKAVVGVLIVGAVTLGTYALGKAFGVEALLAILIALEVTRD